MKRAEAQARAEAAVNHQMRAARERERIVHLERRIRVVPEQLERARLRVLHLEREAERLGLRHLLQKAN